MLGTCNLALEKFWNVEAHFHWSSQDSPRLQDLALEQLLRCCTTDVLRICYKTFVVGSVIGTYIYSLRDPPHSIATARQKQHNRKERRKGIRKCSCSSLSGRLWVAIGRLWAALGRLWELLGGSWAALGRLWAALGALGRRLGGSWTALGRLLGGSGRLLGGSWAALGRLLGGSGRFWAVLGGSWAALGRLWAGLGGSLAALGLFLGGS